MKKLKAPILPPTVALPFKVDHSLPFEIPSPPPTSAEIEARNNEQAILQQWLDDLKAQARANLKNDYEFLRINWQNRFNRPKYDSFDEYTTEEMLLETWEQWYFENPSSLDLKGISKKVNARTGYKYYETGDPVLDELERQFSEGKLPDLEAALGHIKNGENIFNSPVFKGQGGQPVIPKTKAPEVVHKNQKGEKISEAGSKIQHDNFDSDEWLNEALQEDPVMKAWEAKMKGLNDA